MKKRSGIAVQRGQIGLRIVLMARAWMEKVGVW